MVGENNCPRKKTLFSKLVEFRNKFNINGRFFLWKFYLIEFIESINQIINLITIYLCTLETGITITICLVFATDACFRAYQLNLPHSPERRDRQIKIDIAIDFFCAGFPLSFMWFQHEIPISIFELMQLIFVKILN